MSTLELPLLSQDLAKYPGLCMFLSSQVITSLTGFLPTEPLLTLSIGSGTGLLEAILSESGKHGIECVEVESYRHTPKYMQDSAMHYVRGTWETSPRALDAQVWLFIFPREPELLRKYVAAYGDGNVEHILYIGPRGDLEAFRNAINSSYFDTGQPFGVEFLHAGEAGFLWSHLNPRSRGSTVQVSDTEPTRMVLESSPLDDDEIAEI